jgi:Ca2+-binding EF-hand superfamily protein
MTIEPKFVPSNGAKIQIEDFSANIKSILRVECEKELVEQMKKDIAERNKRRELKKKAILQVVGEYFCCSECEEAISEAEKMLDEHRDTVALLELRHTACFLPECGVNGKLRDCSDWALIDMFEKVDTGIYGCVYYF